VSRCKSLVLLFLVLLCGSALPAAVINIPDVTIGGNPYRAFQDTTTGLQWLDLDNFFFTSTTYDSLLPLLSGSGMHLATLSELNGLQASIPAIPANFAGEAVIVGGNYSGSPNATGSRDLIWGIYEDGDPTNGVSYSWKYGSDSGWNFATDIVSQSAVFPDANSTERDLGAWIVSTTTFSPVPEPGTMGIVLLGLASLTAWKHRKQ